MPIIISLLLSLGIARAEFIVHEGFCAGLMNPRAGKFLDSSGGHGYQRGRAYQKTYVIGGRARRVTIGTQEAFVHPERLPEDRIEVPLVNERVPSYFNQAWPALKNALSSNWVRRARVLFADRVRPKVSEATTAGVRRFTYELAFGSKVDLADHKRMAEHLYVRGFGRTKVLTKGTAPIQVAIGGRLYDGPSFYEHLARGAEAETESRWRSFARFVTALNLNQLARNAMVPAGEKRGFRPRFTFGADVNGDLTPGRMEQIAAELSALARGGDPATYDVVVGGRVFRGDDFELVRRRMIEDGVVSIDAERDFENAPLGLFGHMISWIYLINTRLAGLVGTVAMVTPGNLPDVRLMGAGLIGTIVAGSVAGSVINRYADEGEFGQTGGRLRRFFRDVGYLLPNFAGLIDHTSYPAMEARRAEAVVENVGLAVDRHDANEILIVTNGTDDIGRITREFDGAFGQFSKAGGDVAPVRGTSLNDLNESADLRDQVRSVKDQFNRRTFASAREFITYFDPRRIPEFERLLRTPADAAWAVHYFYRSLRAALPAFRDLKPTEDDWAALRLLETEFGPYDLISSSNPSRPFDYRAVRRRADPASVEDYANAP